MGGYTILPIVKQFTLLRKEVGLSRRIVLYHSLFLLSPEVGPPQGGGSIPTHLLVYSIHLKVGGIYRISVTPTFLLRMIG